jgi:hypothetical protein
MTKILLALALTASLCAPALADTDATAWNAALATQLADAVTTSLIIDNNGHIHGGGCIASGYERDPLARSAAKSLAVGLGSAVVLNGLGRLLFHRNRVAGFVVGGVEVAMVANNVRTLVAQNECR